MHIIFPAVSCFDGRFKVDWRFFKRVYMLLTFKFSLLLVRFFFLTCSLASPPFKSVKGLDFVSGRATTEVESAAEEGDSMISLTIPFE